MGENRSTLEKRQRGLPSCYRYKIRNASELIHCIPSSEVECGVRCSIIRACASSSPTVAAAVKSIVSPKSTALKNEYKALVPNAQSPQHTKEFACSDETVRLLFEDRPGGNNVRQDMAYLKVSSPGRIFDTYEKEKQKIPITLSAYLELLKFFKMEYRLVDNHMESDFKKMNEQKECLTLRQNFSFKGKADIEFKQCLDQSNAFNLDLLMTKCSDTGKKTVTLQYTNKAMGRLTLPPKVMEEMGQDLPYLLSFLEDGFDYKELQESKKTRQS